MPCKSAQKHGSHRWPTLCCYGAVNMLSQLSCGAAHSLPTPSSSRLLWLLMTVIVESIIFRESISPWFAKCDILLSENVPVEPEFCRRHGVLLFGVCTFWSRLRLGLRYSESTSPLILE